MNDAGFVFFLGMCQALQTELQAAQTSGSTTELPEGYSAVLAEVNRLQQELQQSEQKAVRTAEQLFTTKVRKSVSSQLVFCQKKQNRC